MISDADAFTARIRALEVRRYAGQLDPDDPMRMRSDGYSWHYRPSHHAQTGLLTEHDIALLSQPGKRLLSVGAHPAYFERLLPELGVPPENILIADNDPALTGELTVQFDMLDAWPDMGTFDRIMFPESLCIALSDRIKSAGPQGDGPFSTDALEAKLLAHVLRESLQRLRPNGEIRANGPQSHPNVVKMARGLVGVECELGYGRWFLRVKNHLAISI